MKITAIKNLVTSRVGRKVLIIQKHSPKLMFAAGVIGIGATVVLACRATLRAEEVLEQHEQDMEKANLAKEHVVEYSEADYQQDRVLVYLKTFGRLTKLYAPAILVGGISVAALTGSHVVLTRRNLGLTAAYAALDKGFREYRERVIKEVGVDKERSFRYDTEEKVIVEETATGPVTKKINRVTGKNLSIYARVFDEVTSRSWQPEWTYNQMFLRCQQNYANDLLKARGHIFLNEIYDMLGLTRTPQGAVVGWVLDGGNSDNFIDFGIFNGDNMYDAMRFVNGDERSVVLDFNVDGVIYDLI